MTNNFERANLLLQSIASCGPLGNIPEDMLPALSDDDCVELAKTTVFSYRAIRSYFPKSFGENLKWRPG